MATPNTHPQEELRKQANEILKGVDQLIKAGKLDLASQEIAQAKSIDPRNSYIYAFEERIAVLRDTEKQKQNSDSARIAREAEARKQLEMQRARVEGERKQKEEQAKRAATKAAVQPRVEAAKPQAAPVDAAMSERKKLEENARRSFEEEFSKSEAESRRKSETQAPAAVPAANHPHAIYKRVLLLVWADGVVSKDEEAQLRSLRESLSLSAEDHTRLENEAKLEQFAAAFRLAWTSGLNVKERTSVVTELRAKFHIPADKQPKIEAKILSEIGPNIQQQTVVVVEDDDAILKLIVLTLENSGFVTRGFMTSDDALVALKDSTADLILSDVNLETSSMGGFSFFEKVRQMDHLSFVPFIFLTGMCDEGMVRYGKSMGADDYMTKPFSGDLLLDTVKGKIKRFRMLQKK